jgi:hypothetical protein
VPRDYGRSSAADIAVYRQSTGTWSVRGLATVQWGRPSDQPVPGDYNADGKNDIAVWRPSTGQWFLRDIATVTWGRNGDIPLTTPARIDLR